MNYLEQLDQMFDATYRLIAIETYNSSRVEDLISQLSRFSNKAYYISKPGRGMYRIGASHIEIPRTRDTVDILDHIEDARHFGIYILCDYEEMLENRSMVSRLKEVISSEPAKVVVLLGENIKLPKPLKPLTMRSKHKLKKSA